MWLCKDSKESLNSNILTSEVITLLTSHPDRKKRIEKRDVESDVKRE